MAKIARSDDNSSQQDERMSETSKSKGSRTFVLAGIAAGVAVVACSLIFAKYGRVPDSVRAAGERDGAAEWSTGSSSTATERVVVLVPPSAGSVSAPELPSVDIGEVPAFANAKALRFYVDENSRRELETAKAFDRSIVELSASADELEKSGQGDAYRTVLARIDEIRLRAERHRERAARYRALSHEPKEAAK